MSAHRHRTRKWNFSITPFIFHFKEVMLHFILQSNFAFPLRSVNWVELSWVKGEEKPLYFLWRERKRPFSIFTRHSHSLSVFRFERSMYTPFSSFSITYASQRGWMAMTWICICCVPGAGAIAIRSNKQNSERIRHQRGQELVPGLRTAMQWTILLILK